MNTFGYSQEDFKKFKKYANRALWMFALLYMFVYNARQNINTALPLMREAFGVGNAETGIVTSALFWCYGFGHLFSGRLSEIFGIKRFIAVGTILSVICNILIAQQTSLTMIAILWGLNGFAQSMIWSPGFGMLAQWWPKKIRAHSSSIATTSASLAQIVTMLTMLVVFSIWGETWQNCFTYPQILPLIAVVLFIIFCKDKPEDIGLAPYQEDDASATEIEAERQKMLREKGKLYPYIALLKEPKFICFCLIIMIGGLGRYGLLTWVPNYFKQEMGINMKQGIVSSILLPVGYALANFSLPRISDKFFGGKREPLLISNSIMTCVLLCVFPFIKTQTSASILLLFVGFFSCTNSMVWSFATDVGTRAISGTASGILDWASYMGAAIQAIFFGFVWDVTGSAVGVFVTIGCLFALMCVLALIARKMKIRGNT